MKKVSLFLFLLMAATAFASISQASAPEDFFAGKWEITVVGTPEGDAKLVVDLVRKEGKLTGHLTSPADPNVEKIPLTGIQETGDKLVLSFYSQGKDVTVDLTKVDEDHLKGSLMSMFDTTAIRIK